VSELPAILERARTEKVSFDIETNSLNPYRPGTEVICFSLGFDDKAYSIPTKPPFTDPDTAKIYENFMIEIVKSAAYLIMHFGVFDVSFVCHKYPEELDFEKIAYKFDTMTGAHVLTGAGLREYNLQYVSNYFCKAPIWKGGPSDWLAQNYRLKQDRTYDKVPPYILLPYAKTDAWWTRKDASVITEGLEKQNLTQTYRNVHDRIGYLCLLMHITGLYTDKFMIDYLESIYSEKKVHTKGVFKDIVRDRASLFFVTEDFEKEMTQEMQEAVDEFVHEINLDSPKQMSKFLFEVLGLPILERTKLTQEPKTGVKILTRVASFDPEIFAALFTYKKWSKYIGYLKNYVTYSSQVAGLNTSPKRICAHSTFSPIGTKTGRLSSVKPNAQNINLGSGLKAVFCCPDRAEMVNDIYDELRKRGMSTGICEAHFVDVPLYEDLPDEEVDDEEEDEEIVE
jgi:DNA polymerase I-like protein with 3'-5' exonuclease and polymerase domains